MTAAFSAGDRTRFRSPIPPPHRTQPGDLLGPGRDARAGPRPAGEKPSGEPAHTQPGTTNFVTVNHEAVAGHGEDAEPLFGEGASKSVALAVFDGMGGAGGARYDVDGVERKGAYIASRLARDVTALEIDEALSATVADLAGAARIGQAFAALLHDRLSSEFAWAAAQLGGEPTKLRSSLVRVLPTTAAIALVWPGRGDGSTMPRSCVACAIWAGDSRVYTLNPSDGLMQLSRDDARLKTDALTSLATDSPIDNCISASNDFCLNASSWELESPGLVFAATDGCFGYLPTPAHFEFELLDTMMGAQTEADWQCRLEGRLASVARDDATLVAAMFDFKSFSLARDSFRQRHSWLQSEFVQPYQELHEKALAAERDFSAAKERRDQIVDARSDCARALWERYRINYERHLSEQAGDSEPAR